MLKTDLTIACNYIEINSVTISASRHISIPLCLFFTEPTTTTRTNHQTPATQPNRDIIPLQPRVIETRNPQPRAATNNSASIPTRTVRQISDTIPLRDLNTESTETRETVHHDLGNDVTDLTVIDLPPAYEDL